MTDKSDWTSKVGETWAAEWQRTDRSFGALTEFLIGEALAKKPSEVWDIGCGAGELSLRIAEQVPTAHISGLDISSALLAVAQARDAENAMDNVSFYEADAATATFDESRPDLLISRHGVMFFADPIAAFSHIRAQAMPNARLVFSCFRSRAENGWVSLLEDCVGQSQEPADPAAPGPFAFGSQDYVTDILAESGWKDVALTAVDYAMVAGEGPDMVGDGLSYFKRIGPAARPLAEMSGSEGEVAKGRLAKMLEDHSAGDRIELPAAAWIVTARAG